MDGDVAVLPTHGFGSFCSATPTSGTSSTIERERTQNPALTQEEDEFVATLLAGFDAYPAYYAHMGPVNLAGPAPVDLSPVSEADAAELRRRIDAGEWVVDLRDGKAFASGHVPGSFNFDATGNLVTYLGWLIPWGTPLTLIGESAAQVGDAQRELVRIGIDGPVAQATATIEKLSDGNLATYETATFAELAAARADGAVFVLDVRRRSEWEEGHVEQAQHIPLYELPGRTGEVPAGPVWVHCASGFRASIAGSFLERAGKDVVVIADDVAEATTSGLLTT